MDCFERAYQFLIERTLARYGCTAEVTVYREGDEEEARKENAQ